jgi:phage shock protein C
MSIADEIAKLHDLLGRGALTAAEFERAKARLLDETERPGPGARLAINRLRRSLRDRWLGGVCGGLGRLTGVESWVWRLIFVLGLVFGGITLFIYVALWILVPVDEA